MPTYDYHCSACDHQLEIFHSMKDSPKKKCPACGKLKLVRQIGMGGGVIFKGSGFYETDYRSQSYKQGEQAENEKTKPKKTDSDSKTDSSKPGADSKASEKSGAAKSTKKKSD